jgi:hypothetical protein
LIEPEVIVRVDVAVSTLMVRSVGVVTTCLKSVVPP